MGLVRDIVKKADNTSEVSAEVKESLNVLMSLAEARAKILEDEIVADLKNGNTTDDYLIPITKVMSRQIEYQAITQESNSNTLEIVTNLIKYMFHDHSILPGIAKIVNDALNTSIWCGDEQEQTKRICVVAAEFPSIIRFDFAFWIRGVKASSIRLHMEKVLSCVAYKSMVDINKLGFNDFLTLYGPVLNSAFNSDIPRIKEMIRNSKEIYEIFYQSSPQKGW